MITVLIVGVPGVPVGKPAVSNITADSLTLAWYGPGYDGGSKVIGYKIEKASCGAAGWTDWSSLSEDCKVCIYYYTVYCSTTVCASIKL